MKNHELPTIQMKQVLNQDERRGVAPKILTKQKIVQLGIANCHHQFLTRQMKNLISEERKENTTNQSMRTLQNQLEVLKNLQ